MAKRSMNCLVIANVRTDLSRFPLGYRLFLDESLHLTIRYEDAGDGWMVARVAEIPGAISQGHSREEARANVIDALDVFLTPDKELASKSADGDSDSVTLTVAS